MRGRKRQPFSRGQLLMGGPKEQASYCLQKGRKQREEGGEAGTEKGTSDGGKNTGEYVITCGEITTPEETRGGIVGWRKGK